MIEKSSLGSGGPQVGRVGYGAMVLEGYYGSCDDDQAVSTIHRALDEGITLIDSADAYGNGHNEELLGRAVKGRSDAFVATKFGIVFDPSEVGSDVPTGWGFSLKINGRPEYVRRSIDASLKRLDVDAVDLWYLHYPDPNVPIEETVG
ncbi:MAG: aldo/keto reductase, partial [Burkholderiaceae bacterium]